MSKKLYWGLVITGLFMSGIGGFLIGSYHEDYWLLGSFFVSFGGALMGLASGLDAGTRFGMQQLDNYHNHVLQSIEEIKSRLK